MKTIPPVDRSVSVRSIASAPDHIPKEFPLLFEQILFLNAGCLMHISAFYYLPGAPILRIEKDINMHKHPFVLCIVNACFPVTYYVHKE